MQEAEESPHCSAFRRKVHFADLSDPKLQTVLAGIGIIVLLPLGIYLLFRAVKEPLRAYASARKHWDETTVPAHLAAEIADATALTIFNPLNIIYWVGVTAKLAPVRPLRLGLQRPLVGNSDGCRGPDELVHHAGRRGSFRSSADRRDLFPPRQCHPGHNPPRVRHVLCNRPGSPFPALKAGGIPRLRATTGNSLSCSFPDRSLRTRKSEAVL